MTRQILLTNDDGIFAPGLAVLRAAVEGLGEVSTLAPDHNASAVARPRPRLAPVTMAHRPASRAAIASSRSLDLGQAAPSRPTIWHRQHREPT